eukprot:scaffold53828_cov31-Attheya_sp.AAC.1
MAILSNLVPCNGDRLTIYGGVRPIVGDLGRGSAMSGMGGVGMGKRVVEEMIFSTATGPISVATLTEASSMVGASASWRIEGTPPDAGDDRHSPIGLTRAVGAWPASVQKNHPRVASVSRDTERLPHFLYTEESVGSTAEKPVTSPCASQMPMAKTLYQPARSMATQVPTRVQQWSQVH